jgi:ribosomal protein S18 acetylase RimI-like enzyme
MAIDVRVLTPGEDHVLQHVARDVFDHPVDRELSRAFLDDPRHHIAVALDADTVVGMASALDYIHPDKQVELWINEVGVAPAYRRAGIATRLIHALFAVGRDLGCREVWVLTEHDNEAARGLYAKAGGQAASVVMYGIKLGEASDDGT